MNNKNPLQYQEFHRRKLPHIQPKDAIFFITYRLDFELTREFKAKLEIQKLAFENSIKSISPNEQKQKIENFQKKQFDEEDIFLANIESPEWLNNKKVANIIKDSLFFRHKVEYELLSYCIMPNHVHILIKPLNNNHGMPFSIKKIIHNHKSFTANQSNKFLNRSGRFWYPEYYDHYIRDEKGLFSIVNYILQNPVKAKLVEKYEDWEFCWINEDVISF